MSENSLSLAGSSEHMFDSNQPHPAPRIRPQFKTTIDEAWDPTAEPDEDNEEPLWTDLQLASRSGDLTSVKEILTCTAPERRAEIVNTPPRGYYGFTALQAACVRGHQDVVRVLLDAGADVHASGGNNLHRNAFEIACGQGNLEIVKTLVEAGAVVNPTRVTRYNGRTPIQAASSGNSANGDASQEIISLLLDRGADVNAPASDVAGMTALQAACFWGQTSIVRLLLGKKANVNAPAGKFKGFTALQAASFGGHAELVELLLEHGADVNAPGSQLKGGTALHAVVDRGHVEIVQTLLAAGADPNIGNGRRHGTGTSPRQTAFVLGRTEIGELLTRAGATGPFTGGQIAFGHW
ncbi:ankyrin repeat-containing domain protein [Coniella lustricola]|uniref:Ankyrin repeat-containing domain protein n=1 Tax=Coniella lustricola TaxID=2025994 RepID=A0A2T3AII0_9PEZI|nr:ankyrin repeat-containing domain protein [Coniella lustricola]